MSKNRRATVSERKPLAITAQQAADMWERTHGAKLHSPYFDADGCLCGEVHCVGQLTQATYKLAESDAQDRCHPDHPGDYLDAQAAEGEEDNAKRTR